MAGGPRIQSGLNVGGIRRGHGKARVAGHGSDEAKLEALWLHVALKVADDPVTDAALSARDGRVRAAALRAAPSLPAALKLAQDEHPRARLEAARVLGTFPSAESAAAVLAIHDTLLDPHLDYALWLTAWELADLWLPAFQEGKITFATDVNQLTFALKAASHKPQAASGLVKLIREGKIPQDRVFPLLQFISEAGQPDDLTLLLELAADTQKLPEAQRAEVLNSLTTAFKQRKLKPTGELNRIESLLTSGPAALQAAAARLAGAWKQASARAPLETLASAAATSAEVRQGALEGLAAMGGNDFLKQLAETAATPDIKVQALALLAAGNPAGTAAAAVKLLGTLGDKPELGATLINSFLKSTTSRIHPVDPALPMLKEELRTEMKLIRRAKSGPAAQTNRHRRTRKVQPPACHPAQDDVVNDHRRNRAAL